MRVAGLLMSKASLSSHICFVLTVRDTQYLLFKDYFPVEFSCEQTKAVFTFGVSRQDSSGP